MTRIYTRTGDGGETSLFGGRRVSKDDLRVRAYGTIDELNAAIGLARAARPAAGLALVQGRRPPQRNAVGPALAPPHPPAPAAAHAQRVTRERITALEDDIDRFEARLPPLRQFVLPGGVPAAAALHHARTVARRAEREFGALAARYSLIRELL